MSRLLWFAGWSAVALWSLFSFLAYGLVDLVGQAAMRNADLFSADPETVEWIFKSFDWLHGFSVSIVLVVWGLVSLAILSVPWIFDRVAGPALSPGPPRGRTAPEGVIDLAPGDYTVRPSGPARPGAVPRIGPRG